MALRRPVDTTTYTPVTNAEFKSAISRPGDFERNRQNLMTMPHKLVYRMWEIRENPRSFT